MTSLPAWHAHPDVLLVIGGLVGAYMWAVARVGPRRAAPGDAVVTRAQVVSFALGAMAMLVAASWPMHDVAERSLYSVHMVQHMLLSLVAPPLVLLGTPAWLARSILRPAPVMRVARAIARPLPALVLFNVVLVLTHWPTVVTASVHSEAVHFGLHVAVFGSALLMWCPVVSPLIEIPRLPYPGQMLYLFLQSLVPTIPASFLTFASHPLYHVYEPMPKLWGVSALTDQMVAGLIMKIGGGLMLWGVIAVLFFRWYDTEQQDGVDVLSWQNVAHELSRVPLTDDSKVRT